MTTNPAYADHDILEKPAGYDDASSHGGRVESTNEISDLLHNTPKGWWSWRFVWQCKFFAY